MLWFLCSVYYLTTIHLGSGTATQTLFWASSNVKGCQVCLPFCIYSNRFSFPHHWECCGDQLAKIDLSKRTTVIPLEAELFCRGCRQGPSPTLIYSKQSRGAVTGTKLTANPVSASSEAGRSADRPLASVWLPYTGLCLEWGLLVRLSWAVCSGSAKTRVIHHKMGASERQVTSVWVKPCLMQLDGLWEVPRSG